MFLFSVFIFINVYVLIESIVFVTNEKCYLHAQLPSIE